MVFGHSASVAAGYNNMGHKTGFTKERILIELKNAQFRNPRVSTKGLNLWAVARSSA
jgi:hypothetical protein